jgi:hypothetical protein
MYQDIYNYTGSVSALPTAITDMTRVRRMFQDQLIPDDGRRHWAINSATEEGLLALAIFNQNAGVPSAAAEAFLKGSLGSKFSYELFATQNAPGHANGTCTAVKATASAGSTTVTLSAGSAATATITKGTIFTIAGDTQKYVVTEALALAASAGVLKISPNLKKTCSAADLTFLGDHAVNLGFHRNAFALAMAPLSELGNSLGVRMNTLSFNDLSLRSKVWYDADSSELRVSLDCLYGIKTLDPQLAFRYLGTP